MGLEVAQYIHQLLETNPTVADHLKFGDDHIRLIKATLKNTFPNVRGPVIIDHTTLNNLPTNVNGKIEALFANREAKGTIKMHDIVNVPQIPNGWALCDGSTVPGYGVVPDLRNQFIRGWDGTAANAGTTEGVAAPKARNAGGHTPVIQGTALTAAQLPPHDHGLPGIVSYPGTGLQWGGNASVQSGAGTSRTANTGAGEAHTHTAEAVPPHTHDLDLPQHYRAVFIVKVTDFSLPTS